MVQLQMASMFFFSGIAVVIALVVVVYLVAWIYDRASGSADLGTPPIEAGEQRAAITLVKDAGLAGLSREETNRIMRAFLQGNSRPCAKQASSDAIDEETCNDQVSNRTKPGEKSLQSKKRKFAKDIETNHADGDSTQKKLENLKSCDEGCCADSNTLDQSRGRDRTTVMTIETNIDLEEGEELERPVEEKESHSVDDSGVEEAKDGVCAICLVEFEARNEDNKLITCTACNHMFYFECFMQWVNKNHTDCPLCRSDMITVQDFLKTAYNELGEQRVDKLIDVNEGLAVWKTASNYDDARIQADNEEVAENSEEGRIRMEEHAQSTELIDPPAALA